ncbi:MAG: hypothetical protein NC324_04415 [Bacteroides sp.]|nr:hypothetical protein [Bacteroides sp.]
MKPILSLSLLFFCTYACKAQTFVESFLKNNDRVTIYHNGEGKEMIPIVRLYLFADNLMPDTSGKIDAGRLLSQWNQYVLGRTTSQPGVYRIPRSTKYDSIEPDWQVWQTARDPYRIIDHPLTPDIIFQPCFVCYASLETCTYYGEVVDSIELIIPHLGWGEINHQFLSRHQQTCLRDRAVVFFDFTIDRRNWFLKGDTLYSGYVVDSLGNIRLRNIQEDLDLLPASFACYFNRLDNSRRIPLEERERIVKIIDDEITADYEDMLCGGGRINYQKFFLEKLGYLPVSCKKAYKRRGKAGYYYGHITCFRVPTDQEARHLQ